MAQSFGKRSILFGSYWVYLAVLLALGTGWGLANFRMATGDAAPFGGISYANLAMFASLALCSACTWVVAHNVYKRRMLARTQALNERLADEISFRDMAIERHCIVAMIAPDGRLMKVNKKFLDAFAYQPTEAIGMPARKLYPSQRLYGSNIVTGTEASKLIAEADEQYEAICATMLRRQPWSGEQVLCRADGRPIVVASTIIPQLDAAGNLLCSVCLLTDITEQKQTGARRQLANVLDDLQDEVFIYDVDSLALSYMNKSALSRFGWTKDSLHGKTIADSAPEFDVALFRRHTAPLFNGSKTFVEKQVRHGDTDVEIVTRLHRDASNRPVFLSVLRDITSRKRIEKVKMETVARVSHELRTPLTSIKGALGLLQSESIGDLPPELMRLVDIANRNSDHLLMVVNDILDLEKMNAGKMSLDRGPENLVDIVEETRKLNSTLGQECGLKIVLKSDEVHYPVFCDRGRISQVITNLLSNAAKFSPRDGRIEIGLSRNGDCVRVSVRDEGPGIPKAEQGKLFKDFSRVESGDGRPRAGTGLGLSICKKLVALHDGTIGLTSVEREGTTVFFDLPLIDGDHVAEVVPISRGQSKRPDEPGISHAV